MRSLARYGVTNAVTRTMLTELLTKEDFDALVRSPSLEATWIALRKTAYRDWVPEDPGVNPLAMEKLVREATAFRFKRSTRTLKGKPKEVGTLLLSRWELDNLEFALRLWHGQDESLGEILSYPSFVHPMPIFEIVGAETIDEIAVALKDTPYFEPITASAKTYKQKRSIFYVEVALERDYYRRVLDAIRALGGRDAIEGGKIIAAEIDKSNLTWLARLLQYYDVRTQELREYMIPGPSPVSARLASADLTADLLDDISLRVMPGGLGEEDKGVSSIERVSLLEHMVNEMAVDVSRRLLAGYPFRITGTLSFYLLKRVELRNLSTVFVGKASGLSASELSGRLYGLR